MKNLIYFSLLLVFSAVLAASCTRESDNLASYYGKLDSLIDRREDFERAKLLKLAELRQKEKTAVSLTDRYLYASLLFDEFSIYNSDSAMKYADRRLDIARSCGNKEWETRSLIGKSSLLAGTGLLREAEDVMLRVDTAGLSADLMIEYYGQMIYLFSHLGNYTGGENNDYYIRERAYKDSMMAVITPAHPEYLWYKGWDVIGTDKTDATLIPALEAKLESSKLNTRQDAKEAYMLSKLYEREGDMEHFRKYMIVSAMVDVRIANAEIASLEELAKMVFGDGDGDIDRAYRYVNYSLNKAISFPNRVRAVGITRILDSVNQAYQERNHQEQQRARKALTLVCVLAVILVSAIAVIIVQNRRLRRQGDRLDKANKTLNVNIRELSEAQNQLNDVNSRLKKLNADLKQKNDELNEANYVKEEYIGYIFTICSNYIRKLEDLRKSIHVKAVTKKYKEIIEETENSDMTREELKDFYKSFDSVFLHIYPDFVTDFNSLLQDDKHIVPKEGELLNTELRIYALVRLGITDSIKIAEFLHCSPQTVYNNRFRVRNRALIDRKNFAEAVRTLGKFMDRPS